MFSDECKFTEDTYEFDESYTVYDNVNWLRLIQQSLSDWDNEEDEYFDKLVE